MIGPGGTEKQGADSAPWRFKSQMAGSRKGCKTMRRVPLPVAFAGPSLSVGEETNVVSLEGVA